MIHELSSWSVAVLVVGFVAWAGCDDGSSSNWDVTSNDSGDALADTSSTDSAGDAPDLDGLDSSVPLDGTDVPVDSEDNGVSPPHPTCVTFSNSRIQANQPSNVRLFFSVADCDGNPIAGLADTDFIVEDDGENLALAESSRGTLPTSLGFQIHAAVLLDLSGSVVNTGNLGRLQDGASGFVNAVLGGAMSEIPGVDVGLFGFATRDETVLRTVVDFTSCKDKLNAGIQALDKWVPEDTSTSLYSSVVLGVQHLKERMASSEDKPLQIGILVTFTDGTDTTATATLQDAIDAVMGNIQLSYTIGVGGAIDPSVLNSLAVPGPSVTVNQWSEVVSAFAGVADSIIAKSKSFYIFGYCTPRGAGDHSVTVQVKDAAGSLGPLDYNADGFTSGCDLDQLVNPCGKGGPAEKSCGLVDSMSCGDCSSLPGCGQGIPFCGDDWKCHTACRDMECGADQGIECGTCSPCHCEGLNWISAADCLSGMCGEGESTNCDDDNPCTDDSCTAAGGCASVERTGTCDDGDPCTTGDSCVNGSCVSSGVFDCDDQNTCTADSCVPGQGCIHAAANEGQSCSQGVCESLLWRKGKACESGVCADPGVQDCDDSNPCTDDSCSPEFGCSSVPNTLGCDDNDPCTTVDACSIGACIGMPMVCEAENATGECVSGECTFECNNGWDNCDDSPGCETNIASDVLHCGSCAGNCPSEPASIRWQCLNGDCVFGSCTTGFKDIDGDCTNGGSCATGCEDCFAPLGNSTNGFVEIPDDGLDNDCSGGDSTNDPSRGYYVDNQVTYSAECSAPGQGTPQCPFATLFKAIQAAQLQDWSNPNTKREIYVARGSYAEPSEINIFKPLLIVGGYQPSPAEPWIRPWPPTPTIIEGGGESTFLIESSTEWVIIEGMTVTPKIRVAGNAILRHLRSSVIAPLALVAVGTSAMAMVVDSVVNGNVDGTGCTGWNIDGSMTGGLTGGPNWTIVGSSVDGDIGGNGSNWVISSSVVNGDIKVNGAGVFISESIVGNVKPFGHNLNGWEISHSVVKGSIGPTISLPQCSESGGGPGSLLECNAGGSGDAWLIEECLILGTVSGDNPQCSAWAWGYYGSTRSCSAQGTTASWTLTNNSIATGLSSDSKVLTNIQEGWIVVNNVLVDTRALSTDRSAISGSVFPKMLRNNAFVGFDAALGGTYLSVGSKTISDIMALNGLAEIPDACGRGGNLTFPNVLGPAFVSLDPNSKQFMVPLGVSNLVDSGLTLPFSCLGVTIRSPGTDNSGSKGPDGIGDHQVPCGPAFDIGCFEYCP